MRRRNASQSGSHPVGHVNVTPMIDVVMCLIVFYLIVGRLVLERRGRVELPVSAVGQNLPEEADPLVISIAHDGEIRLDGKPIALDHLADAVAVSAQKHRVRLRADRALPFEKVQPVLDKCRDAGVKAIELATEQSP